MKKRVFILLVISTLALSCSSQRKVERIDTNSAIDLSGRWNDTDARLVAEEMVADGLSRAWITDFAAAKGNKPTVIVGMVYNKTHELINTETFIREIEREFLNSGKIRLVQAGEAREQLRDERADQQEYASKETMKKWGQERGADFMLQGTVNSEVDTYNNKKVVYYQIDLDMSDLQTNEKVWIGSKKIRKFITN
ncbi:MAG: penicillin-binding protein activator LpoB [Candidatus Latescibacteria bacterium]|nr:penicillin-binding protein activator LpoB [Candidatus Latescibacterota bacterium]